MAEQRQDEARRRRAEGRDRRRSLLTEPFERLEEKAREIAPSSAEEAAPVAKAAGTAAAAVVAAGIAGATRKLLERRRDDDADGETIPPDSPDDAGEEPAERREPEQRRQPDRAEESQVREEPEPDEEDTDAGSEQQQEPQAGEEPEPDEDENENEKDEPDNDGGEQPRSNGRTGEIVAAARHELAELLGHEAESVSSFERCDGGWRVTLEVVDLRRVPDSSDVLSSYTVVLDEDRQLVSLDRARRYRRAQVDPE